MGVINPKYILSGSISSEHIREFVDGLDAVLRHVREADVQPNIFYTRFDDNWMVAVRFALIKDIDVSIAKTDDAVLQRLKNIADDFSEVARLNGLRITHINIYDPKGTVFVQKYADRGFRKWARNVLNKEKGVSDRGAMQFLLMKAGPVIHKIG